MGNSINQVSITNDPILDSIVKGYMPLDQQYIAGDLFPSLKVNSRKGSIKSAGTEFLRVNSHIKVGRGETPEISVSMSKASGWSCEKEGLKILNLREDGEQFNPLDWRAGQVEARLTYGKMIKTALMVAREKEAADVLTSTSVITNNTTLSGASQWSAYSSSNPLLNIKTARDTIFDATGYDPNVAYMGRSVFEMLRFHPLIFDKLGASSSSERLSGVTQAQLALALGVDKVLVGRVRYESAKEGQTSSMANVWGKDFGMLYVNPNPTPSIFEYSFGYEFVLEELLSDTYPIDDPKDAEYVRVTRDRDQLVLNATSAYLIKSAIA